MNNSEKIEAFEKLKTYIEEHDEVVERGMRATMNQSSYDFVIFNDGITTTWAGNTTADDAYVIMRKWDSNSEEDVTDEQAAAAGYTTAENWKEKDEKGYEIIAEENIDAIIDFYLEDEVEKISNMIDTEISELQNV